MGIIISAALLGLYAQGGAFWPLGFVALVPWLRMLDATRTFGAALLQGYLMSVAFTAAVFAWFGVAIGNYTQVGPVTGLLVLLLGAPLFQPQIWLFALIRHAAARGHDPGYRQVLPALTGAAAWVAAERLIPKLLGDTLGHGLYPSSWLRQAADLGGTAGLTLMLLLVNEGMSVILSIVASGLNRTHGARGWQVMRKLAWPLALTASMPLLMTAYGWAVISSASQPASSANKPLRMGLVQSNLVDYERLRKEKGSFAVVRDVLDLHYAMSYDAVERQHVDAVLWSETVYPTTFGHPKSQLGAEMDQEILGIVRSAKVPFVLGTYDLDAQGEYNAAAFVTPDNGLLGMYRKTRLFPLTEYVPDWLGGAALQRWLPWTGGWKPGSGARVFPLRLADGRDIPVLPMICLDDVDTSLAIAGARLGAQAILTMSNDSWFTDHPQGAALHQAVAAFRSIETRLPQFRVTSNGYSAVIDAMGHIAAGARMGERTLVVGALPVSTPPRTLMVAWGDWLGWVSAAFLAFLRVMAVFPKWQVSPAHQTATLNKLWPMRVAVLPPAARLLTALLRAFAGGSLLCMAAAVLINPNLQTNTLAQIRLFAGLFLVPEAMACCVLLAFGAKASIDEGMLVLARSGRRLVLPLQDVAAIEPWRLPLPGAGLALRLVSGQRWRFGLACLQAGPCFDVLARTMIQAGAPLEPIDAPAPTQKLTRFALVRRAIQPTRLSHPVVKFGLLPLVLALPAFRLHQHIAYGSTFGEYYTFGLKAYLTTFGLWWAAWAMGVVLCAAVLRAVIEVGTALAAWISPNQAMAIRQWLERSSLILLYLGLPAWLLLRMLNG